MTELARVNRMTVKPERRYGRHYYRHAQNILGEYGFTSASEKTGPGAVWRRFSCYILTVHGARQSKTHYSLERIMSFATKWFTVPTVILLTLSQSTGHASSGVHCAPGNLEPAVVSVHIDTQGEAEKAVRRPEQAYRDALMQQDVPALGRILADDFIATSSRGEIRDKAKEIDDIKPSPDFKMEA
jgi:hypothetical protein